MKRYPHYWWPLTGCSYPSRIAVIDCDSAGSECSHPLPVTSEQLARWCLTSVGLRRGVPSSGVTRTGDSVSSAWGAISQLLSSRDRTWLFASPSSRILPLIDFWRRLEDGQVRLSGLDRRAASGKSSEQGAPQDGVCVIEDPPTVILCQLPDRPGKLVILDIRNWGIDLLPEVMSCGERTSRYTKGILSSLSALRTFGQVSVRSTAGSQAMQALRSDAGCVRLHCHTHAAALSLERAAYFGGRCECYRLGEIPGPVYHVDVRSMYPALCLTLALPVSLRRYHAGQEGARAAVERAANGVVANVTVRIDRPTVPFRRGTDTVYPVGHFRTTLCGQELHRVAIAGEITDVHSAAEYTCAPVLSGYAARWLNVTEYARGQLDPMAVQFCKRVANAICGKMGEQGRTWAAAPPQPEMGPYAQWWGDDGNGGETRYRNIAWHTQREQVSGESYWSVPACAAWITAAGRSRLWDYITTAGRANVWYVDTDSLLVNRDGWDRLLATGNIGSGSAGYLRLIGQHSRCTIYGIRHYQLDDTVCCAGVVRGEINPGETREQYWQRQRIAADVSVGRRPDGRVIPPPPLKVDNYRHGRVMPDGGVLPLEIYDGD